jgi:hypothetical protein
LKPLNYHDLLDAFAESGCPVCRLLHADGERFLDLFFHENVMDFGVQAHIRAARLMCNPHAWQLLTFRGRATDTAVLTDIVLYDLLELLQGANPAERAMRTLRGKRAGDTVADSLEPTQPCICCAHVDRMEHNYIDTIAAYFGEADMQEAYRVSEGLCLPHFRLFLRQLRDPALTKTALEVQMNLWRLLKGELELFLERTRPGNEDEIIGAEADSWRRAVRQLVGERDVFGLRRKR